MLFYSRGYLAARGLFRGETFVLTLFALLGMMVMISAGSFVTLYLGLELPGAVALRDGGDAPDVERSASEAAMKYFVLGALASGMLLYGMSMIYGATGSLDIVRGREAVLAAGRATGRSCSSGSCSWSRASRSSSARCRTTCGCPTFTTARRRR